MSLSKEPILKILKDTKLWINKKVHSKKLVISVLFVSSIVGATVITQGFDAGVEKKEEVVTTVEPSYNYFKVSLDNEKKDGLLIEAKAELIAKQKIEEKRLKEEAERKAKAEAEVKAKALAEAKAKAEAEARAKKEAQARAEAEAKAKVASLARVKAEAERMGGQTENRVEETPVENGQKFYHPSIPIPREQQAYLYQKVKERGLDLAETLAVMKVESSFNPNAKFQDNYGYFQVNAIHREELAEKLHTVNNPLNPYVNINWGTYLLSQIHQKYLNQGLTGEELKEVELSVYNKGEGGYQKTGKSYDYIRKVNQAQNMFETLLRN